MKKIILSALAVGTFAVSSVTAQNLQSVNATFVNDLQSVQSGLVHRTTTCGPDTVRYPFAKATGLAGLNVNSATSAQSLSQYYDCPQSMDINAVTLYAYKTDLTGGVSQSVTVAIYLAGLDSMPTGTALASTTLNVDTTFGNGSLATLQKDVSFTPITVTQPYCVVFENLSANPVVLVCNSYTAGDGQAEWLAGVNIGGNWIRSYSITLGGSLFDADPILMPHVTYDITADYTMNPVCISGPGTANFTNASSPIIGNRMYNQAAFIGAPELSYTWDYGDFSNEVNEVDPSYTYSTTGPWNITLSDTMYGWTTTCADAVTYPSGLAADFGEIVTNLTVNFGDMSIYGPTSWLWDFGDGNVSTQQNPTHTYASAGTYTVCLTVTNATCGSDSVCNPITVTACAAPSVVWSQTSNGLVTDFTDASTNTPTSWFWDFGDGNVSTQQNPTHTYLADGTYTVCLTATNVCGTDSTCQSVVVSSCTNPVATWSFISVDLDASFTDASTGTPTTWFWDFGDGNTSTSQSPTYTYATPGTYTVCLTVTNACGSDSSCQTVTITCPMPTAGFTFNVGANGADVDFTSTSTGAASYAWDFGDGNTSTMQDPSHTYAVGANYAVCLITTNNCGSDTICQTVLAFVGVDENALATVVQVYPNPASDQLNIAIADAELDGTLTLINALGQVIDTKSIAAGGNAIYTFDVSGLAIGTYYVQVHTNAGSTSKKVTLVR